MIARNGGLAPRQVNAIIAKVKDLNLVKKELREKLKKEKWATKEAYDLLSVVAHHLHAKIKNKSLNTQDLNVLDAQMIYRLMGESDMSIEDRINEVIQEKNSAIIEMAGIIATKEDRIAQLEKENSELKAQNATLITLNESLIKEHRVEKAELETQIAELNEKNAKLQEKVEVKTATMTETEVAEIGTCIEHLNDESSAHYCYESFTASILRRFTPKPIMKLIDKLFEKVNKQQEIIQEQQVVIMELTNDDKIKIKGVNFKQG